MSIHKFETDRIILRPLAKTDIESVYEYNSDYEVIKYMHELSVKPDEIVPYKKTELFLETVEKEWKKENPSFYEFAVEIKSSLQKMIGNVCVYLNEDKTEGELGWSFNRNFHGKGYATEAAMIVKKFAFEILKVKRLIARCDERNIPSERVMQKIGLKLLWEHGYRKYPNTCEEATEKMYYEDNKD